MLEQKLHVPVMVVSSAKLPLKAVFALLTPVAARFSNEADAIDRREGVRCERHVDAELCVCHWTQTWRPDKTVFV